MKAAADQIGSRFFRAQNSESRLPLAAAKARHPRERRPKPILAARLTRGRRLGRSVGGALWEVCCDAGKQPGRRPQVKHFRSNNLSSSNRLCCEARLATALLTVNRKQTRLFCGYLFGLLKSSQNVATQKLANIVRTVTPVQHLLSNQRVL